MGKFDNRGTLSERAISSLKELDEAATRLFLRDHQPEIEKWARNIKIQGRPDLNILTALPPGYIATSVWWGDIARYLAEDAGFLPENEQPLGLSGIFSQSFSSTVRRIIAAGKPPLAEIGTNALAAQMWQNAEKAVKIQRALYAFWALKGRTGTLKGMPWQDYLDEFIVDPDREALVAEINQANNRYEATKSRFVRFINRANDAIRSATRRIDPGRQIRQKVRKDVVPEVENGLANQVLPDALGVQLSIARHRATLGQVPGVDVGAEAVMAASQSFLSKLSAAGPAAAIAALGVGVALSKYMQDRANTEAQRVVERLTPTLSDIMRANHTLALFAANRGITITPATEQEVAAFISESGGAAKALEKVRQAGNHLTEVLVDERLTAFIGKKGVEAAGELMALSVKVANRTAQPPEAILALFEKLRKKEPLATHERELLVKVWGVTQEEIAEKKKADIVKMLVPAAMAAMVVL